MGFVIRVDCNRTCGFGHFSRSLNFARHLLLESPRIPILFFGELNQFAQTLLQHYGIQFAFPEHSGFAAGNLARLRRDYHSVLVDSYAIDNDYLRCLGEQGWRIILIDDFNQLDYSFVDVVINFRLNAENLYQYNSRTCYLGLDHFITKPEFRPIRSQNLKHPKIDCENIFLFLSGTVVSQSVNEMLIASVIQTFPHAQITYVTPDSQAAYISSEVRVSPTTPFIENYYSEADLIISGGGLVKYESVFCGIPNLNLAQTPGQYADSLLLAEHGLTYNLGVVGHESLETIGGRLSEFANNPQWRTVQIKMAQQSFKTNSGNHLIRAILSKI